jgi:hypothetical protein
MLCPNEPGVKCLSRRSHARIGCEAGIGGVSNLQRLEPRIEFAYAAAVLRFQCPDSQSSLQILARSTSHCKR